MAINNKTQSKKKAVAPDTIPPVETVLVLRTCTAQMTSHNGFKWPESGPVSAPDWRPDSECGHGLHGFLWGEGNGSLANWDIDAKWLVCSVPKDSLIDIGEKVKFPACEVVFCGDRNGATEYIKTHGPSGKSIIGGTATAGYRGTATAGYRGTATAGDSGTATAGDSGTATAGYRGTATAGTGGVVVLLYWNGKRYKAKIANVQDEDGDGQLKPNVKYRLNNTGQFEEVL